jgi:hypothetical protein
MAAALLLSGVVLAVLALCWAARRADPRWSPWRDVRDAWLAGRPSAALDRRFPARRLTDREAILAGLGGSGDDARGTQRVADLVAGLPERDPRVARLAVHRDPLSGAWPDRRGWAGGSPEAVLALLLRPELAADYDRPDDLLWMLGAGMDVGVRELCRQAADPRRWSAFVVAHVPGSRAMARWEAEDRDAEFWRIAAGLSRQGAEEAPPGQR